MERGGFLKEENAGCAAQSAEEPARLRAGLGPSSFSAPTGAGGIFDNGAEFFKKYTAVLCTCGHEKIQPLFIFV